jgi:uridine kinase
MKDNIIITIENNKKKVIIKEETSIYEMIKSEGGYDDVIAATIDGDVVELNTSLKKDTSLTLVTINEKIGNKIYINGLKYVYIVAVKELFGKNVNLRIKHSIDKGIYTELKIKNINKSTVTKIKQKMKEIINKNLPIEKINTQRKSAIEYFKENKEFEKTENYRQISNNYVTMYELMGYYNYFYYFMPISTGILKYFDLTYIEPNGIVLQYPTNGIDIPKYTHIDSILKVFNKYETEMNKLNISYVSDVNKIVSCGRINEFIQINELLHNDIMRSLTEKIVSDKKIKMVLIGGPSCSGKTTTSKKLGLYLKTKGMNPFVISTDDYYVDRGHTPKDENGDYDYERIEAIDVKMFNEHLLKLINYEEVKMPTFNFITGEKEFKNAPIKLEKDDIIIIEGLHTLNEELTSHVSKKNKFKIYASPFTPIALDRDNHVSTTDLRLLRRLVRDYSTRGYTAEATLSRWKKMRKSEEMYVFPYQAEADAVVNTALLYEINALRVYAEPLLYSIDSSSENYKEAIRLINFLKCFFSIPTEGIPDTSVLREFIGKSYFE